MGMSAAGMGSNLDVDGIVSQLMTVEKQPLAAAET
jgi:flagellar hook-associated protein 2